MLWKSLIGFVLLWLSYTLPVFCFETLFIQNIEQKLFSSEIYLVSAGTAFIGFFICLLHLWLGYQYAKKRSFKFMSLVFFVLFYIWVTWQVANGYKRFFGNTWLPSEVIYELLLPHWYFYVLAVVGLLMLYISLRFTSKTTQ